MQPCPGAFFNFPYTFFYMKNDCPCGSAMPKFILTMEGCLRIGMVHLHSELVMPGDEPIGGGFFDVDYISNRLILYRQSHDYGVPRWHLVETLRVPKDYRGYTIKYIYDDGWHEDYNVSDSLPIEYYDDKDNN